MPPHIDQIYSQQGHDNDFAPWKSQCRLRIFQPHPESTIVIATDLGSDGSPSITHCAAHLASQVVTEFQLDPAVLTWIEYLPHAEAACSLVEFDWRGAIAAYPRWSPVHPEQVEALIGQRLV